MSFITNLIECCWMKQTRLWRNVRAAANMDGPWIAADHPGADDRLPLTVDDRPPPVAADQGLGRAHARPLTQGPGPDHLQGLGRDTAVGADRVHRTRLRLATTAGRLPLIALAVTEATPRELPSGKQPLSPLYLCVWCIVVSSHLSVCVALPVTAIVAASAPGGRGKTLEWVEHTTIAHLRASKILSMPSVPQYPISTTKE